MTRKVRITDADTGEELRETYSREERKVLGLFTVADIIKIGSVWVAIIGLIIGFDYRLKNLEADKLLVAVSLVKLAEFVKASDTFNSSFFRTQFENGKPVNPSFRSNNGGSINQ